MGKGARTRETILDHALTAVSTAGLEKLSIGELAKAVGMSKSGLFAHFQSKEQLQLSVLRQAVDRFVARVVSPALKEPRGEPRVRAFFEGWLRWDREEFPGGCVFQAAANELDDRPGPVRDYLVETQRDWFDTIATAARIAVDEGHFREDLDTRQLAFELMSLFLGYHRHERLFRDAHAERLVRTSFDDLLSRARG